MSRASSTSTPDPFADEPSILASRQMPIGATASREQTLPCLPAALSQVVGQPLAFISDTPNLTGSRDLGQLEANGPAAGADRSQSTLLPESLDDWVDESNPVRVIDAIVDALNLAKLGFDRVKRRRRGGRPIILRAC
jgi:hypothetical protein